MNWPEGPLAVDNLALRSPLSLLASTRITSSYVISGEFCHGILTIIAVIDEAQNVFIQYL